MQSGLVVLSGHQILGRKGYQWSLENSVSNLVAVSGHNRFKRTSRFGMKTLVSKERVPWSARVQHVVVMQNSAKGRRLTQIVACSVVMSPEAYCPRSG